MARTNWDVYVLNSGNQWVADGTLPAPNQNLTIGRTSTKVVRKLANGAKAFMTPSVKKTDDTLLFEWLADDGTIKIKVSDYVLNDEKLKIVDHNAIEYIGWFVDIKPVWLISIAPDEYDLQANFERE